MTSPTELTDLPPSSDPAALPSEGFFADIISSVFDGGVNHSLILGMHLSFAGLVLVLLALYVLSAWNIHVLALTGVSLCLWISTGWFVMELLKVQKQQEEEKRLAAATGVALGEKGRGTETVDLSKEGKKDR